MSFSKCLHGYLKEAGCTASELAEASGLQKASISRYLSGKRVPKSDSDAISRMASALAVLSDGALNEHDVAMALLNETRGSDTAASFSERLHIVLTTFGVARNQLARSMDFDPSYISRILSGQRRPADLPAFVNGVADYIGRNYNDSSGFALASSLTGEPLEELSSSHDLARAIRRFLDTGTDDMPPAIDGTEAFLKTLDEFDLNDFLAKIHFDDLRVPTVPFQLPTTKTYEGIEQMKAAELDFLKAAVMSKSTDDVIMYSDMPLEEMAEDKEFPKKVMTGIALLVRKGIRLRVIHNVHRPLNEMFMGLEGWIPLYLTGQMESHYLPHPTNDVFLHFMRSAGSVAVSGEAIAGNQGGGRYIVFKGIGDVAYVRRRAEELLALSKPLISVFAENDTRWLAASLERLEGKTSNEPIVVGDETFKNMKITVWPNSHALIEKGNAPKISLLVEHPALVEALGRYKPTLF